MMLTNIRSILIILNVSLFTCCVHCEQFLCDKTVIYEPLYFNVTTRTIDLPAFSNNFTSSIFAVDDDPLSDCIIRLGDLFFWENVTWDGDTVTIQSIPSTILNGDLNQLEYLAPNNNLIVQLRVSITVPLILMWNFNITYLNLELQLPSNPHFTVYLSSSKNEPPLIVSSTRGVDASESGEVSISVEPYLTDGILDIVVIGPPFLQFSTPTTNQGLTKGQFIAVVICVTLGGSILIVGIVILISIKGRRKLPVTPAQPETSDTNIPLENIITPKPTHIIT